MGRSPILSRESPDPRLCGQALSPGQRFPNKTVETGGEGFPSADCREIANEVVK